MAAAKQLFAAQSRLDDEGASLGEIKEAIKACAAVKTLPFHYTITPTVEGNAFIGAGSYGKARPHLTSIQQITQIQSA